MWRRPNLFKFCDLAWEKLLKSDNLFLKILQKTMSFDRELEFTFLSSKNQFFRFVFFVTERNKFKRRREIFSKFSCKGRVVNQKSHSIRLENLCGSKFWGIWRPISGINSNPVSKDKDAELYCLRTFNFFWNYWKSN